MMNEFMFFIGLFIFIVLVFNFIIFRMSGPAKRPRLEDEATSTHQQLIQLLEKFQQEHGASPALNERVEKTQEPRIEPPKSPEQVPGTIPKPNLTPQTTPANDAGSLAAALSAIMPALTSSSGTTWPTNRGHGGRGRNYSQASRSSDRERGLLTLFVCMQHRKIYCQLCNEYIPGNKYWEGN